MGSKRFANVTFHVFSNDHCPAHVHASIGNGTVKILLAPFGSVLAIKNKGMTKSELRQALKIAAAHYDELVALWRKIHG